MADNLTTQTATLATVPTAQAIGTRERGGIHDQRTVIHRQLLRLQVASSGLSAGSGPYVAGDQVGPVLSAASAFRSSVLSGTIVGVTLIDEGDVTPTTAGYDLYLWYDTPTLAADNAAGPAVSDAHSAYLIGKIELPAFRDEGGQRSACWIGAQPMVSVDTSLRFSFVTRGDHTFFAATDDLNTTFLVEQD